MTVYEDTVETVRALAERARTTEDVLFCETRPLTSLEARYAKEDRLAHSLREVEDDAIASLQRLVDAEQGYESALEALDDAGSQASEWLRAVMLSRAIETLKGER